MTLQECYKKLGGDYEDVLLRLTKKERIEKYLLRFPQDPTFYALEQARKEKDYEGVFCSIHTLKGVSMNLGFGNLYEASSALTEAVREKQGIGSDELFEAVKQAYLEVVEVIKSYQDTM